MQVLTSSKPSAKEWERLVTLLIAIDYPILASVKQFQKISIQ